MSLPAIKIDRLNFYYDYKTPSETLALKNINLEVAQGQYVVFFGPSGCGKTTLIYLIAGITTEKAGTGLIEVNGKDVLQLSKDELAVFRQTGIGIIFQQFNLIPSLTVVDNVALPMTFIGIPQEKRREEAHKILARLGMDQFADRYPSALSGGQQQRVGIARALANNPPIIIADEPLGNLDSENAEHVLKFLKELQEKDGRTIIMVTHEAWSVRDADKIIYLKDGTVVKFSESPKKDKDVIPPEFPLTSSDLYRELYPDLTSTELMVKALSNLLLRGFSADEIKRFEFFLGERLAGKIDAITFEKFLDRSYKDEGVGLWKQRAIKLAALTEDLITEKQRLTDIYAALEKDPEAPLTKEVELLSQWVLKDYRGAMPDQKKQRLEEAVMGRLRGNTTAEDFRTTVNLAFSEGGVGLPFRTTQRISERLESALALGHAGGVGDALASHLGAPAPSSSIKERLSSFETKTPLFLKKKQSLSILEAQATMPLLPPGEEDGK